VVSAFQLSSRPVSSTLPAISPKYLHSSRVRHSAANRLPVDLEVARRMVAKVVVNELNIVHRDQICDSA
jgi:hypothetical protein